MNDLELLRVLCAAAEAANFREAAARLGVSPQVVTRSVRVLEERLGEALFHRSTRQVRITAYGEQLRTFWSSHEFIEVRSRSSSRASTRCGCCRKFARHSRR